MAEFSSKTYYFKLTKEKSIFFKVDKFEVADTSLFFVTCLNNGHSFPVTREGLEKTINGWMTNYGAIYSELNEEETEKVKLIYDAR